MKILVTGSAGHLGEALMRMLHGAGHEPVGFDIKPSPHTGIVGSIADAKAVSAAMDGVEAVIHTATLHKPHVATHTPFDFLETNVTGTETLLQAATRQKVGAFLLTSTTSAFGRALGSEPGQPAHWIDETVRPVPKNIYGVTKTMAEDLCELAHRRDGLACMVLRTSRFFPEEDDNPGVRAEFSDQNAKANEFLNRRVDIEDAATAHLAALDTAPTVGFDRYIISARTPFDPADPAQLGRDPSAVVARYHPDFSEIYSTAGFRMAARLDRVYDSRKAQRDLGWRPKHDFGSVLAQIARGDRVGSTLARDVGIKGYHAQEFKDGPYPVV